jgi:hypothetical protein
LGIVAEWSMVSDLYTTFKFVVFYLIEDEKFSSWCLEMGNVPMGEMRLDRSFSKSAL